MAEIPSPYEALSSSAAVVDLSDWTQLEIVGDDPASFLHNLTTNDIRRLSPGQGCEAFVTNVQGKTIGHVWVFCNADSLSLVTVPGQGPFLGNHLEKYHIREKVEIRDRTDELGLILVSGPLADKVLEIAGMTAPPRELFAHVERTAAEGDSPVSLRRVDLAGPEGVLIAGARAKVDAAQMELIAAGAVAGDAVAFETARIEYGTPLFGRDASDANLPQELARDARAISFTKGCYLGQETVARIDALGHVNRTLVGVRFVGEQVPAAGTQLAAEGKTVGQVASAAHSPKLSAPLALAFVRRGHNAPGSKLESPVGPAEVVSLPA